MRNKKVCYGDCKVCANKKECDERSKILLENIFVLCYNVLENGTDFRPGKEAAWENLRKYTAVITKMSINFFTLPAEKTTLLRKN